MAEPRTIPCASAAWTRPGLGRGAAGLAALLALLPLIDLLLTTLCSALGISGVTWLATVEQDGILFAAAALLALLSGKLGALAWPRLSAGSFQIDAQGILLSMAGSTRRIPLDLIRDGLVTRAEDAAALVLHLRGGARLTLSVDEEKDAEEALAALDLGPDKKRLTMILGSPGLALTLGCAGICLGPLMVMWAWAIVPAAWLHSPVFPSLMCALSITLMLLFGRLSWPEAVTIGADGIGIRGRLRSRFIPYDRLLAAQVLSTTQGLVLTVEPPKAQVGRTGQSTETVIVEGYRLDLVMGAHRRIEAARAAFAEAGTTSALSALDPAGKGLEAWIASLRALAAEARSSYRRPSVSVESLVELLSRPDTEAGPRIGAAIALKGSGHEGAAERIRIAAESVASDELRAALENIAAEEEVSLPVVKTALGRKRSGVET